jgi:hypothetical protein
VRFILSVFVIGIDLQRVALDDRPQQIKTRVLIPSPAFVKIEKRKEADQPEQRGCFPRRGIFREQAQRVFRTSNDTPWDGIGGPTRIRTWNQQIMSLLL